MNNFFKKLMLNKKAQTAIELAVFGAILVFVLGLIIRQSLGSGYAQNQPLRAMRYAMLMSELHSTGGRQIGSEGGAGNTSRNVASVLIVEDRLTASNGKYGALERIPLIANATATHSHNFFMPIDPDEPWNAPRFDVFINGIHFPLLVAGYDILEFLDKPCGLDDCGGEPGMK